MDEYLHRKAKAYKKLQCRRKQSPLASAGGGFVTCFHISVIVGQSAEPGEPLITVPASQLSASSHAAGSRVGSVITRE